jgi:hypothetical protein
VAGCWAEHRSLKPSVFDNMLSNKGPKGHKIVGYSGEKNMVLIFKTGESTDGQGLQSISFSDSNRKIMMAAFCYRTTYLFGFCTRHPGH